MHVLTGPGTTPKDKKKAQQELVRLRRKKKRGFEETYIDNIQDLLLNHNLLVSKPSGEVAILARARTLTGLQGLDPERKGRLVQFLYEAQLIGFQGDKADKYKLHNKIIDLFGAVLSYTHLSGALLIQQQLDQVLSCKGAILPKGLICNNNL